MVGLARRTERHRIRAALVAVLVCGLVSVVSGQRYLDSFRDGLNAMDQRRWQEAARLMRLAINERGDTGERVRRRAVLFEDYIPSYFLGVALFQLRDFQGAVSAFDAAEQAGYVRRNAGYYSRLQDLRNQSRVTLNAGPGPTRGAPLPTTSVATTTTSVTPTTAPSSTTTSVVAVPVPVPVPTTVAPSPAPVPAELLRNADAAVQRANQARRVLDTVVDLDVLRQMDATLQRLDGLGRADLDAATARLINARAGSLNDAQQAIALAQKSLGEFQQAQQSAADAVRRITAELVAATRPFFQGQYAGAKTALERLNYPGGRFAVQWRLFRSAAAYALYVAGNEQDAQLRQDAESNLRELRRIAPRNFRPDVRAFSPRFVRFFVSVT